MDSKLCRDCKQEKPLAEFYRHKKSADGYEYRCKPCSVKHARQWAIDNPERHLAAERRYIKSDKYKVTRKARRARKREEIRATERDWYYRNREEINARRRLRWNSDPEWRENRRQYYAEWRARNPFATQERSREILYGLSPGDYTVLLEKQDGKCAICKQVARLAVDHDHDTLEVRGLLCAHCNAGIGQFLDDPKLVTAAARYLRKAKPYVRSPHGEQLTFFVRPRPKRPRQA